MGKESRRKELGCQERHFRKDEDWEDLDLLKMSPTAQFDRALTLWLVGSDKLIAIFI